MNKYGINEHVHRLAAWAASRAASPRNGSSFQVKQGKDILEESGMTSLIGCISKLPEPDQVDQMHKSWREKVIQAAAEHHNLIFTHGIAAKLINIYLKVAYVNLAFANHEKVATLHPPIDRELLNGLVKVDSDRSRKMIWKNYRDKGWTSFDSQTYENVIKDIKEYLANDQPLWKIEEAWQGFQNN